MPSNRSILSLAGQVAERNKLDPKEVYNTYMAYWAYIRKYIGELELDRDLTEEEFNDIQVSVNVSHIGKFYSTYPRYLNCRKRQKLIQEHRDAKDKES